MNLENIVGQIQFFLECKLSLRLHLGKIEIRKLSQGIDFLGYIILPHYKVLRTKAKRRMLKKVNVKNLSSYLGLIGHANSYNLKRRIIAKTK